MAKDVELSSLDLRFEGYRMKNAALEERLLASIAQRGIEEPLEGVELQEARSSRTQSRAKPIAMPSSARLPPTYIGFRVLVNTSVVVRHVGRWLQGAFRNFRLFPHSYGLVRS